MYPKADSEGHLWFLSSKFLNWENNRQIKYKPIKQIQEEEKMMIKEYLAAIAYKDTFKDILKTAWTSLPRTSF